MTDSQCKQMINFVQTYFKRLTLFFLHGISVYYNINSDVTYIIGNDKFPMQINRNFYQQNKCSYKVKNL